jgi:hypothetical protein
MGKAGRPKLLQKDGYHRHDGYDRLHPIEQFHRPDLHTTFDIINGPRFNQEVPVFLKDDLAQSVHSLISGLEEIEKYEIGTALVVELQKSIATLLSSRRKKRKTVANSETRPEQVAIGDNEQERREPNTIGLP